MSMRRGKNLGERERAARNRKRRMQVSFVHCSVWVTYKLGSKHLSRFLRRKSMAVADAEKRTNGAPENP
jgi:hypothetical protein